MQRMIPVERLAREDRMVLIRARKAREIREEQNLDDRVLPFDEEALRARMHGIFCGEVQAMEAAGRTLFDFVAGGIFRRRDRAADRGVAQKRSVLGGPLGFMDEEMS